MAPVAGSKWTLLQPPPLGAARTPFLLRARGKPVEKLVTRFLGRRPVPVSGIQGALTAGQTLFWHPPPDLSAGRPLTRPPDVRRSSFLALCRRPDGRGEVIFGREWGLILMQIFKVKPCVSANSPPATPPRAVLRPGHTAQTLFCAAPQRLRGCVARAQVVV